MGFVLPQVDATGKKAILLLAETQTGKTSLRRFLAGQEKGMTSIEKPEMSGNYCLDDGNEEIGSNGCSKTLKLSFHQMPGEDVILCDCPGFNDMRGAETELQQVTDLAHVASKASLLKIAFIVDHHKVEQGQCINGFLPLVEYAVDLIVDPIKYRPAVSLVVTKVPNRIRDGQLVGNNIMLKSVKAFLSQVLVQLQGNDELNLSHNDRRGQYANFISALIADSKIALFRHPDKTGPVSEIDILLQCKHDLKIFLGKQIVWVKPVREDFRLALSESARKGIDEWFHKLSKEIPKEFGSLAETTKQHFNALMNEKTPQQAEEVCEKHIKDECAWERHSSTRQYSFNEHIKKLENRCKVCSEASDFTECAGQFKQKLNELDVIQTVVGRVNLDSILCEVDQKAVKLADFFRGWRAFLKLYSDLCSMVWSYEVQAEPFKYDVERIASWGHGSEKGKKGTVEFISDESNFKTFLRILQSDLQFDEILISEDFRVEKYMILWVSELLNQALRDGLRTSTSNVPSLNTLEVSGCCVVLSEVLSQIEKHNPRQINVFAWDTLFIDCNVDATGKEWKLALLAPRWCVVQKKKNEAYTISLNGSAGPNHEAQAKAGTDGRQGDKGQPGLPGGPAGALFGAGFEFENGKLLTVTACGGAGGPGQDGGAGAEGKEGVKPSTTFFGLENCTEQQQIEYSNYVLFVTRTHKCEGPLGGNGAEGGEGGRGGYGGSAGAVTVVHDRSNINTSASEGEIGIRGSGGAGGLGGQLGTAILVTSTSLFGIIPLPWARKVQDVPSETNEGKTKKPWMRGKAGNAGKAGKNEDGLKDRESSKVFLKADIAMVASQYIRERRQTTIKYLPLEGQKRGEKFSNDFLQKYTG